MIPYFKILGRFFRFFKKISPVIKRIPIATQLIPNASVAINKAAIIKPNKR